MPKISKVVDLTKVNRRHSEIVFRTSKCDALHLEIDTGITAEPDATAELYVKKPNGKIVSQVCTMNDTVAIIDVLNSATDIPGLAEGIIKITDSEGEYCAPTFRFAILDSFAHEDSIGTGTGTGITAEQAAQIQANKTAIQTINKTIGNKNELPVGDANIIASINRIDSKTSIGGTGLTPEQEAKLNSIDNKVDKINGKGLSTNDYTNEEKQTVASLKATVGDTSSGLVKDVKDLKTNGVSQDNINSAIENYLTEHPVQSGATAEQAAQIEANRTAIGDSNSGLIKEINNIKNTELQNLNTAILGVNETLGDKTRLPSGDANVIASINRIDRKTTTGNGLTAEQEQQLRTAYEHSQSPHITTGDVNNAVSTYVTGHKAELKGDNGQDGVTPTLKVGSVTTLEAGNNATVTMSADNNEYTLNFGIPKGAKGDVGAPGSGGSSSVANSEWSGKVASFLGDSITYGVKTTKTYHQYLKELVGFSACNNYGIDGASITDHSNGICTRYNNVASNSDIIFIFGGTNDFYYNKPLGEWYTLSGTTRTLNKNMSTFRGALAVICDGLITKFPTKQIVLMTPIHRDRLYNQQTDLEANASGLYLDDYVECVKEAGKIFGIPVIDLNGESGLYPMNAENANAYFHTTDKLHPNADGHLKIARTIQGKLRTILPVNINYVPNVYGDIVLSKTSITMDEGTSSTFTVKLDKAPTNSQVVTLSVNNADVTLSANTLTFTSNNYNQTQEVRINVTKDSDKLNDNCTITLSSSGVTNKTVVLTINDITVDETEPDTPSGGDGDLTGKSYKLTFNGSQGGFNHVVFVIPKDEDCVSGATLNMKFDINNAVNFPNSCNVTKLQIFNSSTPEVNNGVGAMGGSQEVDQTTTFSNGSASIDFNFTLANANNNYLKIPYGLKPTGSPASIDISNIAVTVNGKSKPIVAVGAFFATENCEVSEETTTPTTYTIINNLTNITNSNSLTSINEGSSYLATLTADSGYTLDTVTVTMGGSDVTSTVYSSGTINISSVSGNIVITASATKQGTGEESREWVAMTVDELTGMSSIPRIDDSYNLYLDNGTGMWFGARITNVNASEYKFTLNQTNNGQCTWYMYNYDSTHMYVLCIGKGNGEHGKRYKMETGTSVVSQIDKVTMATTPVPGDEIRVVVNGTTQTLYCNDTELITLSNCNTVGVANQPSDKTKPTWTNLIKK